jgi:sulfatase maturation enzyme AslB (radical SAM superfamily)
MMHKYFPIKTATACQLKWNWSTLYLYSGQTASCHRTGHSQITSETFDTFHNTEKKQQERQKMLQGLWPEHSCSYCQKIESAGGFSDRMLHLNIPDQSPVELETDPHLTVVTPTILEVYFNNTCNMSCLYCGPHLSSKINQENRQFGDFFSNGVELKSIKASPDHEQMLEKFWQWMRNNSSKLKRFNVLGGEPFYQIEFDQLLDYFETSQHPDLELGIITNLMIDSNKLLHYLNRFKKLLSNRRLKTIDITCSIDCLGPEQEYVRYGIKIDHWMKNFEIVTSQKWLTININQTISLLTIKTMPELLVKLKDWRKNKKIGHYFSAVAPQPTYLMIDILGADIFANDFQKILDCMPNDSEHNRAAYNYMEGLANLVSQSTPNIREMNKLKIYLDEKDRRRNTDWKTVFPWLVKELEYVV